MRHGFWSVCRPALRKVFALSFLVPFVCCFGSPQAFAAAPDNSMVARLGSTEFHAADFADFLRLLDPNLRKQAMTDPEMMSKLIGLELARMAILKEAKDKNWTQRAEIARQIERAHDDVIVLDHMAQIIDVTQGLAADDPANIRELPVEKNN
jgi:hypothetical protein